MRRLIATILIVVMSSRAHAGAWTQAQGQGLQIEKVAAVVRGGVIDLMVERYVEFGLWQGITLIGSVSFTPQDPDNSRTDSNGALSVALRQQILLWRGFAVSQQAGLYFPRNNDGDGFGVTQFEQRLALGWGGEVLDTTFFVNAEIGFRLRANGVDHDTMLDVSVGYGLSDDIQMIASVTTTGHGDTRARERREQISLVWQVTDTIALETGASRADFGDRGLIAGKWDEATVHIALWRRF